MTTDVWEQQAREWDALYALIREVLREFGREDYHAFDGDYLLVDENLGLHQHRIETEKPELVQPVVVKTLHQTLIGYPNWEIVIALAGHGIVIIRDDEIIDGLRRESLPTEFQTIEYEGSRPLGSHLGDVIYGSPSPF